MKIDIPTRLRTLRAQHSFKQQSVAEYCKLKRPTYQSYEEGRAEPSLSTLLLLKELYGFKTIDDLLDGQPSKPVSAIERAYRKATMDKRKIVDFVLGV